MYMSLSYLGIQLSSKYELFLQLTCNIVNIPIAKTYYPLATALEGI